MPPLNISGVIEEPLYPAEDILRIVSAGLFLSHSFNLIVTVYYSFNLIYVIWLFIYLSLVVDLRVPFDSKELIARIVDGSRFTEFKKK